MTMTIIALALITFHGPTGARIDLNGESITSIRDPAAMPEGHFARGTNCIVVVDGGMPVAVRESCDEVRQAIRTGPCVLVCGETKR